MRGWRMIAAVLMSITALSHAAEWPNVLFIAVDDLRPQLGCYGRSQMVSPNIDALAARGMLFERAYCQQAVCAPSRVSLLTGARPNTTKVHDLNTPLASVRPDLVSLPRHFKSYGYTTISLGKIYHHGGKEDPEGWSEAPWYPPARWLKWVTPENEAIIEQRREKKQPPRALPYEAADVEDEAYSDGQIAAKAIEQLRRLQGGPFFLAVGFDRPHLPFNSPRNYWDLYDADAIKLADNPFTPKGAPEIAMHNSGELRQYYGIPPSGSIDDDMALKLVHGYFAAVSYVDAQIGKVLDELDHLGLRESTVVILWGDHGWHLGDHGLWCKHSNFESATHSPLIIAGPGVTPDTRTAALTEFIDIYPSLCEMAGLPLPPHLEGDSFVPLLQDPRRPWKRAAYSQYPRGRNNERMGYSVRTDRYRFTRWLGGEGGHEDELYDHHADPKENVNLAADGEHRRIIDEHAALLERVIISSPDGTGTE